MKTKHFLALAVAAIVAAASAQANADESFTLRFSNATNVAAKDAAKDLMKVAKEESDGTIKVKHFPDNMLGDDRVATESTINGDIDLVMTQPTVLTSIVPDT